MTLERYASPRMMNVWDQRNRLHTYFLTWLTVTGNLIQMGCLPEHTEEQRLRANVFLPGKGPMPPELLGLIAQAQEREKTTGHDVKAALEVLAGHTGYGYYHAGLTGRDVTDTTTQILILEAEELVAVKAVQLLKEMQALVQVWSGIPALGMTHNQPAQLTTYGRKLAIYVEQLYLAIMHGHEEPRILRTLSGPIGTGVDLQWLLDRGGAGWSAQQLSHQVFSDLLPRLPKNHHFLDAQGQIYPRSFDKDAVGRLVQLGAALSNLAHTVRLMSGRGDLLEGYPPGRVGSSSMPHKRNPSRSERLCGLYRVLCGYEQMLAATAGQQWEEGDVSCSVVQRVALPEAFLALDAMLEQAHVLVSGLHIPDDRIQRTAKELYAASPGVLSSLLTLERTVLDAVPREQAYEQVKGALSKSPDESVVQRLAGKQVLAAMGQVAAVLGPMLEIQTQLGEFQWMESTV